MCVVCITLVYAYACDSVEGVIDVFITFFPL